jgi:predicted lipoprotein with Yx(FWY)xxD motif
MLGDEQGGLLMRRTRLLIGFGLLAVLLAIAAVACGDDDDGEEPAVSPTAGAAETPTAEAPEATGTVEPPDGTPSAAASVIVSEHPELGSILTDAAGRTLYTFSEDPPNVSTCQTAPCPQTWPPFTLESGTPVPGEGVPGNLAVIERQDGSLQVTHDGRPLHYFVNDTDPGDANGQGIGGRWFAVQVEG